MCINIGSFSDGAGSFVVADTRVSWSDGTCEDPGGKIVSTGSSGWATGCGKDANGFTASLAALRDSGPIPFQGDASRDAYTARVAHRANQLVRYSLEANQLADHPKNIIMLVEPDTAGVIAIQSGKASRFANAIAFPSDLEHEEKIRGADFLQDMRSAPQDLGTRIRCAAAHFASAALASKVMSDVMEIGYILPTPGGPVRGFLRGKAAAIVNAEPSTILEQFQATCGGKLFREIWDCEARDAAEATLSATGTILGGQIDAASVGPVQTQSRFRCKVNNSASQSIPNTTLTNLTFNTELWDVGGLHSTSSNTDRITVPAGGDTGVWTLSATVEFAANATGRREVRIWHMPVGGGVGTIAAETIIPGLSDGGVGPCITLPATAQPPSVGDFFIVEVWQNSTAALNVQSAAQFSATHQW